jgi:hypothetical protein
MAMVVEQVFSNGGNEKIAVLVCVPRSLIQGVRGHVEPWIRRGR